MNLDRVRLEKELETTKNILANKNEIWGDWAKKILALNRLYGFDFDRDSLNKITNKIDKCYQEKYALELLMKDELEK